MKDNEDDIRIETLVEEAEADDTSPILDLSSILFFLLLVIELLVINAGLLVLLILGHQVVHVAFGLSEFHLVHTLSSVPMQESLSAEHGSELFTDALEQLLDGSGVSNECSSHFQASGWNVADGSLDVVGDPFDKVGAVLVLDVQHLLINLFHGHSASKYGGDSQVAAMAGITGGHHIFGIKHLLGQLWHGKSSVLLTSS